MSAHRSSSTTFLKSIAYLQVIGIILVVLGHSLHMYPDGDHGHTTLLFRMIYSFHMPLFLFASGFLMVFTERMRSGSGKSAAWRFVKSKILRLLLPFAVLTLVTFVPRTMMSGIADDPVELSAGSLCLSLTDSGHMVIPYFWFIQASFLLLCFNYIVLWLTGTFRHDSGLVYLLIVALFTLLPFLPVEYPTFFSTGMAVGLGIYFATGMLYARFSAATDRFIRWSSPVTFCIFAALWVILFFARESGTGHILCGMSGIAMCLSLANILETNKIKWLDHLAGANYIIFLLSWYCNVIFQQVLHHFVALPWWVHTLLSLISGIYIPWLAYRYLQRHKTSRWSRLTAFLLGQKI